MHNFDHIAVGDEVVISRGRSPRRIATVTRVTPKQFRVEGFGALWKHNGKGVGDSDSWYATYAYPVEPGDRERINAEWNKIAVKNAISRIDINILTDEEKQQIADIVIAAEARRS